MAELPWWALPLVAAVFGLGGAALALAVAARLEHARARAARDGRSYEERRQAYVALLAAFERSVARLRAGFAAGVTHPDPMLYLSEVGPALVQVRLVASGPVRNAALAVHRQLEDMHGARPAPGQDRSARSFIELLNHVPLVMHDLERAVRAELGIDNGAALLPPPRLRQRVRSAAGGLRRLRAAAGRSARGGADPD